MKIVQASKRSLSLLAPGDRRRFRFMVVLQMGTSLLDLVGVMLLGVVAVLAASTSQETPIPAPLSELIDRLGLGGLDETQLVALVGAIAAILLIFKSTTSLYMTRRIFKFLAGRAAAVSADLSGRFFASSLLTVQAKPSQEMAYALGPGTNAAILGVLGAAMVVATELSLLVILGAALLLVDPWITVGAILYFALLAGFMQRPLSRWAASIGQTISTTEITSTTVVQEGIDCYREVSVLDRREYYRDRYRQARSKSTSAAANAQFLSMIPKGIMEVALVLGAVVLVVSQALSRDLVGAAATLVVFLAAGTRVMPSILRLQGALATCHTSSANAETTYELAASLSLLPAESGSAAVVSGDAPRDVVVGTSPDFTPTVEISCVTLTYPSEQEPALIGISAAVEAGQSLALVGSTGAGKSTLADVILGVLVPDEGFVLVGGIEPSLASQRWPGAIAYVPQTVALGHGSVRENVALGIPPELIDDNRIWEALERAHLADFLSTMRDGLDTQVGEHGVRMSGGQRQRLGVARALYTRPQLLVLDEATSALDAETENAIAQTMLELEGSVTTITVAHRLATIRNADLVAYLERGVLVAIGEFDEVRSKVPNFDRQASLLGL